MLRTLWVLLAALWLVTPARTSHADIDLWPLLEISDDSTTVLYPLFVHEGPFMMIFPLYYRTNEGSDHHLAWPFFKISEGEVDPLKGPTDVGTAGVKDEEVALSSLVDKLNDRFGTDFTKADQLFFDQIRASAEEDERIIEAANANNLENFTSYLNRIFDDLFIDRMEGNEDIFARVMTDIEFRSAAQEHLAAEAKP